MVKITDLDKHSYAYKKGVRAGDVLVSINGNLIHDVLDYRFYLAESDVTLLLSRGSESFSVRIKKGEYDDIGLSFETPLMDKKHSCKNKCIFCFIDQNPRGLRESLYFKDDDSRLSFIHGNYVTLTNMSDDDVERIIKMRMSPINISVHTTDPELRVAMMKNKHAGDVLRYLDDFKAAGLSMCAQVVLCRGVNDGERLKRTLSDLAQYYPALTSVAVVPAGLTKHREGLYPLSDFTAEEAASVIDMIDKAAERELSLHGGRLFFAADELYLKAGLPIPADEYYEDYPQLENGVGMMRSFLTESGMAVGDIEELGDKVKGERTVTVVTGAAAYNMIVSVARDIERVCPRVHVKVEKIINRFYGESITVTGLLTGKDIYEQLRDSELGCEVLIPENCLRYPEEDFLCGMTRSELEDRLGVPVRIGSSDGYRLVEDILGLS